MSRRGKKVKKSKKTTAKKPQKSVKKSPNLNKAERVPSGIPGLDRLIGGGFIKDDIYLVSGGSGTGKTLFCCQFLWEGLKKGEKCIYYSLEERPEDVIKDASVFGWDFKKYIKEKKCKIEYRDPFELMDITSELRNHIKRFGATRVIFDSTSIFGMVFEKPSEIRKRMYELIKALKGLGAVVIMTAEIPEGSNALSRYHVEEFVVDGVVVLYYSGIGGEEGSNLQIRKMRRTNHGRGYFPLKFSKNGLKIEGEGISVLMK